MAKFRYASALVTAREILADTVCRCGHVNAEHEGRAPEGRCCLCPCRAFRPVRFRVEVDDAGRPER